MAERYARISPERNRKPLVSAGEECQGEREERGVFEVRYDLFNRKPGISW